MKILIFPVLLAILLYCIHMAYAGKQSEEKKVSGRGFWKVAVLIVAGLFGFTVYEFSLSIIRPDTYCLVPKKTASKPPATLQSAEDYFRMGNYEYDTGNCRQAIIDYTQSIRLDPTNAQVLNNRAYTYMRMQDYASAVPDLDKAIELRPEYVNALINRADIYNFYYRVDHTKAIALYDKVIALGATKGNSVCGHKAMAQSGNMVPLAILRLLTNVDCR